MWQALRIPSLTHAGTTYWVRPTTKGPRCDCPSRKRPCKHERIYLSVQAVATRCALAHGTAAGMVCAECLASVIVTAARKVQHNYKPKPPRRRRGTDAR